MTRIERQAARTRREHALLEVLSPTPRTAAELGMDARIYDEDPRAIAQTLLALARRGLVVEAGTTLQGDRITSLYRAA